MDSNVNEKVPAAAEENKNQDRSALEKAKSQQVLAAVYPTEDGLSFAFSVDVPDDRFVNVTIDERCSTVEVFSRQDLFDAEEDDACKADRLYLNNFHAVVTGQLKLINPADYTSPEEIITKALEFAVERLSDKDDDLCAVCTRRDKCTQQSDEQGEAWQQPSSAVCADHVVEYFLAQAKKGGK
ncbi:MAG: hypothetical protein NC132_01500 [Corallococcus sp.]|nr:hypothetical protein [Corallococcus sp.]MCM1359333.1 hypothetical protein [Corallococcus sp.]MCM1394776.1 hypothetical protein [Corallococcus sp.]